MNDAVISTTQLIKLPDMLIKNAAGPLVKKTNPDFIKTIAIPSNAPTCKTANITAMFARPNFAPGGKNETAGKRLSKNERVSATAARMPSSAVRCAIVLICGFMFITLIRQNIHVAFALNKNTDSVGNTS